MPWFVVDDNAHSHPKMIAAGNAALGLWLRCGAYAAQHLTDGIVPGVIAKMYGSKPQIVRLVAAGLWHEHGHTCKHPKCAQPQPGDYFIHDYLDPYNPSREEVERKRRKAADKKRTYRAGLEANANRDGIDDESHENRERFDDDSSTNHTLKNDDFAGHGDVSLGDSSGTRARAFPSPPLPSTTDVADVDGGATGSSPVDLDALAPTPIEVDGFEITDAMRAWALRTFGPGLDIDYETAQFVDHFRAQAVRRPNWPTEWQKWIRRSAKYASERARRPGNVIALPGQQQPLTGTDAKVAGWAAIAEQLREQGSA